MHKRIRRDTCENLCAEIYDCARNEVTLQQANMIKRLQKAVQISFEDGSYSIEIVRLRDALLWANIVKNNSYFHKYLELLQHNLNNESLKYFTNAHHAIPVHTYRCLSAYLELEGSTDYASIQKYAEADLNNFKVNLSYADHVKAHIYLGLASKGHRSGYLLETAACMTQLKAPWLFTKHRLKNILNNWNADYENQLMQNYKKKREQAVIKMLDTKHLNKTQATEAGQQRT